MSDLRDNRIIELRRSLQNPYAYSEEQAEIRAVLAARKRSENPYAFIEHLESNEPVPQQAAPPKTAENNLRPVKKSPRRSDADIEDAARALQTTLWARRFEFFDPMAPLDPLELLDPALAFGMLGYEFDTVDALGQLFESAQPINVAGLLDKSAKKVLVSGAYPPAVRHFTAAHELGHAILHEFSGMHRDKPLQGMGGARDPQEVEADKFAAHFLMPRNLLTREFEKRFGKTPFVFDDASRFALVGSSTNDRIKTRRQLSRTLASTARFNGRNIVPLNLLFRVSAESMAIRLEELNLLNWTR